VERNEGEKVWKEGKADRWFPFSTAFFVTLFFIPPAKKGIEKKNYSLENERRIGKKKKKNLIFVQLLATDISALATMKNAANCDKLMRIAELSESSNF